MDWSKCAVDAMILELGILNHQGVAATACKACVRKSGMMRRVHSLFILLGWLIPVLPMWNCGVEKYFLKCGISLEDFILELLDIEDKFFICRPATVMVCVCSLTQRVSWNWMHYTFYWLLPNCLVLPGCRFFFWRLKLGNQLLLNIHAAHLSCLCSQHFTCNLWRLH